MIPLPLPIQKKKKKKKKIDLEIYPCFSGSFLEDAMVVSCGHSFGGLMLRRVIETVRLFPFAY